MEEFGDSLAFLAGIPAIVGLTLAAATILVTSDWRLALSALLLQYLFLGLTLTRFIQPQVALVRVLTGSLVVPILYLTARQVGDVRHARVEADEGRFLGLPMSWGAGPLGLPLRLLTVFLATLALVRFFPEYSTLLPSVTAAGLGVTPDVAFVALWLVVMGIMGIVLSGEAMRVAPAVLTVLCGFDLIYASLEQNLAIAGFFGALTLLAALAFSYLAAVQGLAPSVSPVDEEEEAR